MCSTVVLLLFYLHSHRLPTRFHCCACRYFSGEALGNVEAREGDLFAAATRRSGVLKRQLTAQDETIAALKDAVEREQRHVRKLMKENAVQRWAALSRVKQLQLANSQLVEVGW